MKESSDNNWISFSDIMTVLMVIFLFISISYMIQVRKEQKQRDRIFEEYSATKQELYQELDSVFEQDFENWEVILDEDLSIKFTNPDVLFQSGQTTIRPYFGSILNKFLPKYFEIILKDKYKDKIAEIRVEGHTDKIPAPKFDNDPYIANTLLSQARSARVLKYFRNMAYFTNLSKEEIKRIEYLLTANGLSYGRTVDSSGQLTMLTKLPIDNIKSRRVEFKIVTTSEKLIDKVIDDLNNK